MTAKMWLLVIQALPIIARLAYPFVRPILKKHIDDPTTTQDEEFLSIVDAVIRPGKVES